MFLKQKACWIAPTEKKKCITIR